jgi:spore maturation protein CgeB
MKLVIFGLTISSSWGNGHATLWRGLTRGLGAMGWDVVFFERDVSFYAGARDSDHVPGGGELVLYRDWADARVLAREHLRDADAAIVTSYCPDGVAATDELLASRCPRRIFYDLDTPVTLDNLAAGRETAYIGPDGLRGFDLVLSFTGGPALDILRDELGAKRVAPLYGHVDPDVHRPTPKDPHFAADLSYLGTYAQDRQAMLEELFIEPARLRPDMRFVIGGAQYPADFPWTDNIYFVRHLPPGDHAAFFSSGRITLNVTRAAMARMGWCPSGRLFEAAACGAPIVTDDWPGLSEFFTPGQEIIVARNAADTLAALDMPDHDLATMARRARERVLDEHTSLQRARELAGLIESLDARTSSTAHAPFMET